MRSAVLSQLVKKLADQAGFDRCGITVAVPSPRRQYLRAWLDSGRSGSMQYLHRNFNKRAGLQAVVEGARSIIVVALGYYRTEQTSEKQPGKRGRVAKYAWGNDYHKVLKDKLFAVVDGLRARVPEPFQAKVCVDTAPVLERELAAAAGIGWIGKNTMLLHQTLGSYFFLGVVVTTLDLAPDEPLPDRCGICTACLEACPTGAFPAPYQMDAARCISYLTIEHRGKIPAELEPLMGDWLFGCDICQEVCPYNRRAPETRESQFAIRSHGTRPLLDAILGWTAEDYRRQLRGSAMKRATLEMLQRNARIVQRNLSLRPPD